MESVNLKQCKITGGFFAERQKINATATVNAVYDRFKETGRMDALKCVPSENKSHIYWDSDVAKWLEAAAYILCDKEDEALREKYDGIVNDVINNQLENGYFNSYFQVYEPDAVFTRRGDHELYCAGHLFEAAVAAKTYLGDDRLLRFSEKYADYIIERFTVKKDTGFSSPGHEEIELALMKLFRLTGKEKYLRLAEFFIDQRGREENAAENKQIQSHLPVREQKEAVGHAVRALYLYSGMADLAMKTGDKRLIAALDALADDIISGKTFVTGGVGNCYGSERFAGKYDLPNERAYSETCAAIALAFFADRMFRLSGDKKYGDVFERALYNGILSGISLDGTKFFYTNPLEIHADKIKENETNVGWTKDRLPILERVKVFDCSCCPPNVCRFIAELSQYVYYLTENSLVVSQYITSSLDACGVKAEMTSDFPYSGKVGIRIISAGGKKTLKLRKPFWSDEKFANEKDGFLTFDGISDGKEINVDFGMKGKRVYANDKVYYDAGKVAFSYGPVVLCAEGCDNGDLSSVFASADGDIAVEPLKDDPKTLAAETDGYRAESGKELYSFERPVLKKIKLRLLPYFAWANRAPSDMKVWFIEKN